MQRGEQSIIVTLLPQDVVLETLALRKPGVDIQHSLFPVREAGINGRDAHFDLAEFTLDLLRLLLLQHGNGSLQSIDIIHQLSICGMFRRPFGAGQLRSGNRQFEPRGFECHHVI